MNSLERRCCPIALPTPCWLTLLGNRRKRSFRRAGRCTCSPGRRTHLMAKKEKRRTAWSVACPTCDSKFRQFRAKVRVMRCQRPFVARIQSCRPSTTHSVFLPPTTRAHFRPTICLPCALFLKAAADRDHPRIFLRHLAYGTPPAPKRRRARTPKHIKPLTAQTFTDARTCAHAARDGQAWHTARRSLLCGGKVNVFPLAA